MMGSKPSLLLTRKVEKYRDDRIFLIACEDRYGPVQYFSMFAFPRVELKFFPTLDGASAANHVVKRVIDQKVQPGDQRWILLDTDRFISGTQLPNFLRAVKDAEDNGVKVAISRPCFEVWILLHFNDPDQIVGLSNASDVEARIKNIISGFSKTRLKIEDFSVESVSEAFFRAIQLDESIRDEKIPPRNSTRVYRLLAELLRQSPVGEIPSGYLDLRTWIDRPVWKSEANGNA